MKVAPSASVDGLVPKGFLKLASRLDCTRIGPGKHGRDRLTSNVKTEEAVPEGRDGDPKDR
jgi:hypothetical protein